MRTRGGHSLCADADQARLHHRAPRAHAAEPIAAGKKTSHAGPTADPAAVEPTAPDRPFLGRADRRANDAAKVASRALSALLALPTEPWRELVVRLEEHTSELQSLMRTSYAVFCLIKKNSYNTHSQYIYLHH